METILSSSTPEYKVRGRSPMTKKDGEMVGADTFLCGELDARRRGGPDGGQSMWAQRCAGTGFRRRFRKILAFGDTHRPRGFSEFMPIAAARILQWRLGTQRRTIENSPPWPPSLTRLFSGGVLVPGGIGLDVDDWTVLVLRALDVLLYRARCKESELQ